MEMRADVLIVGAGMVGSALALALKDSGLEILLLDGSPLSVKPFDPQAAFEPRVSALSAASQRILERLGAKNSPTSPPRAITLPARPCSAASIRNVSTPTFSTVCARTAGACA